MTSRPTRATSSRSARSDDPAQLLLRYRTRVGLALLDARVRSLVVAAVRSPARYRARRRHVLEPRDRALPGARALHRRGAGLEVLGGVAIPKVGPRCANARPRQAVPFAAG